MSINVYDLANMTIQCVHKNMSAIWRQNIGYKEKSAGYIPTPQFIDTPVEAQIQSVATENLQLIDGMNLQGISRSIWLHGDVKGIDRSNERGGDLLIFPQQPGERDQVWKVVSVAEAWPTWAHVIAVLQNDNNEEEKYYGQDGGEPLDYGDDDEPEEDTEGQPNEDSE